MDMPALHNAAMNHATQLMLKPDQYNIVPLASQTAGVATTLPWILCMYLRLHIYAIYNIYYIILYIILYYIILLYAVLIIFSHIRSFLISTYMHTGMHMLS